MAAKGRYIVFNDMIRRAGRENLQRWASLDNDDAEEIEDRFQEAINVAEDDIDDRFRALRYQIPFGGAIPTRVKDWAAWLAVIWIYELRGFDDNPGDDDPEGKLMSAKKKKLDKEIDAYTSGKRQLDAELNESDSPTAPAVPRRSRIR